MKMKLPDFHGTRSIPSTFRLQALGTERRKNRRESFCQQQMDIISKVFRHTLNETEGQRLWIIYELIYFSYSLIQIWLFEYFFYLEMVLYDTITTTK